MLSKPPEPPLTFFEKLKIFLAIHWRGFVSFVVPLILLPLVLPPPAEPYHWVGYTLVIMATFWVTECIPLAVTSFLPMIIFPLTNVMTTTQVCKAYINDTILMFLGSLFLAYSVEQSGLHKRLAYTAIKVIGYSHCRLLLAICIVTTFISMWITNTAATTMMVPINFAILKVFEGQKLLKIYTTNSLGETIASDITTCYFCAATYSATIGGIGTLVGSGTNLAFKGLFLGYYPDAPEYLSFPLFSAFGIPYMILLEACVYLYLAIFYFGLFRPASVAAKSFVINKQGIEAAKKAIADDSKEMGAFTFWEGIVAVLFSGAMFAFFSRSPQIFTGWGDQLVEFYGVGDKKFIRDSALAMIVCVLMFALPSTLMIFKNCRVKFFEELPKGRIISVLDWKKVNAAMPWSFMFLLGGGFALSEAAKTSGLNDKMGESFQFLKNLPNAVVILFFTIYVIFITNFASNVAVANVMVPLSMDIARKTNQNPLWYCIVTGFSASHCFMLPVGTPGNLIVQSAAKISTKSMIVAGAGPTVTTIIITWLLMAFYAPVIWPDLHKMPAWVNQ